MDTENYAPSKTNPPNRTPEQRGREKSWQQFSLLSVFAAITTFGLGAGLMRVTFALSTFNLIGIFIVGASFGIPVGYAKAKWSGAILFAFFAGTTLIVLLILICMSGVLPENKPPPSPLP